MRLSIATQGRLLAWLSVIGVATGCSGDSSVTQSDPLLPALQSAVDNTIIPSMERFATEAAALNQQATELCGTAGAGGMGGTGGTPPADSLRALQDRWLALSKVWNQGAVYYLDPPNPLNDDAIAPSMFFIESMRPRGEDYTSDVQQAIKSALESSEALDEAFFSRLTFNQVGMLALEVLLFEDYPENPGSTDPDDIVQGYASSERKCSYLVGMAALLADRAALVELGWTEDFNETGVPFRDLLLAGQLEDGSLPVPAVIVATAKHLEYLRVRKLDGILDARIATKARPEESPPPFWANLEAGLDSVEDLMEPPGGETGFFDVMSQRGFDESVTTVRQSIDSARDAVRAEDESAASEAFLALETNFRREVPEALGINLGIGFTDGD